MLPVFGLYTHIRANRIRSAFLIGALFVLFYVVVFAGVLLADSMASNSSAQAFRMATHQFLMALPIATVLLAAWCFFSFRFNQSIIGMTTGARDPLISERRRIAPLLEEMCISRGVPCPKYEILESAAMNAFATGVNDEQYTITVTTGLLNALDDRELKAVIGHELTHIRNEDVRLMVIAVVVAGVIAFFAEFVFRMLDTSWFRSSSKDSSDSKEGAGAWLAVMVALALLAVAWFLSLVIRLGLSRSREFLADAGAVELTKDPDAMISALRKIDTRGEIDNVPSGVMEMCLDNPRSGFADLFSTHPSIEARIAALQDYAGGHDLSPPVQNDAAPNPQGA